MWSVLLLLVAVQSSELRTDKLQNSLSCPKFLCNDNTFKFNNSTCGTYFQDNFHMQACQDPMKPICTPPLFITQDFTCVARPAIAAGSLYPGQMCGSNDQCRSNTCIDDRCYGLALNGVCAATADCAPNSRCDSTTKTCQPLLAVGTACTVTSDCAMGSDCHNSVCIAVLSLPNGEVVTKCDVHGINKLCATGSCRNTANIFSDPVYQCEPAAVTVGTIPVKCGSNDDCVGKQGNADVTGVCSCGYNEEGQSYCHIFSGDAPVTAYLAAWKFFTTSTLSKTFCHSEIRDSKACYLSAYDVHLVQKEILVNYDVELFGITQDCIKNTAAQFYYEAFGSIATFIAALLLLN